MKTTVTFARIIWEQSQFARTILTFTLSVLVASAIGAAPVGTAFTYQGRLTDAQGVSATGLFDLQFTLFDAVTNGAAQGLVTKADVPVTNGLVTVELDFGTNVFVGAARWLEMGVRPGASSGAYSLLSPRQSVTPTPYALHALNAAGTLPGGQVTGSQTNVVIFNNSSNSFTGTFIGNGSGLTNLNVTNISGLLRWQVVTGTAQQALPNTGYIADNILPVTITLPASPAIGDVIRVSGAGTGGWKIAQNPGQFIPWTSIGGFGVTWTARESNRAWQGVASSADGSKLAAVVYGGQIYTSTDSGVTWTPRESNREWRSVASSADGSKLVAVVGGGQIYTSPDSGLSWTAREGNRGWTSVASSADGSKLVAVAYGGQIYTSTDSGVSWTARESGRNWFAVASSADGGRLVAAVYTGQIYTSTDSGVSWTPRGVSGYLQGVASSADGARLVAVVGGTGGQIYTSTDYGVSWTARETTRQWGGVASSADGGKLVAVVQISGQIYTSVASTTSTGTGGSLIGGSDAAIELQYIGNGQFRVLSSVSTILAQ